MLIYGIEHTGITAKDLADSAAALRPNLVAGMRRLMFRAKGKMVQRAQALFTGTAGRTTRVGKPLHTVDLLRRARVTADVTPTGVIGQLAHRALILNILEGGAQLPARDIRPVHGLALRYVTAAGEVRFARGVVHRPAATIRPRPIQVPALEDLVPVAQERLAAIVEKTVLEGRADGGGGET
jgi:hypothetical protein